MVWFPVLQSSKNVYHQKIHRSAKVKTLTITKEAYKWFASFSAEIAITMEPKQNLLPLVEIELNWKMFPLA